jgi:hypothetical protein
MVLKKAASPGDFPPLPPILQEELDQAAAGEQNAGGNQ